MASTIAAITTGIGGIVTTADATGNLSLLSGTSTVVSVTSAGAAVTGTMSVSGATTLTGGLNTPLAVTSGGTGLGTLTANNVILGAGTSNPTFVAPSTTGNVLTSNGTTWTSAASSGGVTTFNGSTTGLTPATATSGAITLGGTLAVANGGTGVTTSTGSGANVLGTSPTLTTPTISTITSAAATALTLQSAGTTAITVNTSQNVGIGTASPTQKLHVIGAMLIGNYGGNQYLYFDGTPAYVGRNSSTGDIWLNNGGAQNTIFGVGGTEQMRIDSAGLLKFNSGYGSAATAYGCRAWVNFNSTGTVSIYGSGNCSSITDNGVGNFTFNFTTAMPDVNYSVTTGPTQSSSNNNGGLILVFLSAAATYSAPLVGSFRFINVHAANTALGDSTYNCLSVFR